MSTDKRPPTKDDLDRLDDYLQGDRSEEEAVAQAIMDDDEMAQMAIAGALLRDGLNDAHRRARAPWRVAVAAGMVMGVVGFVGGWFGAGLGGEASSGVDIVLSSTTVTTGITRSTGIDERITDVKLERSRAALILPVGTCNPVERVVVADEDGTVLSEWTGSHDVNQRMLSVIVSQLREGVYVATVSAGGCEPRHHPFRVVS